VRCVRGTLLTFQVLEQTIVYEIIGDIVCGIHNYLYAVHGSDAKIRGKISNEWEIGKSSFKFLLAK
jgi:hypothetical protein